MITFNTDENNDFTLGRDGNLSLARGTPAIAQTGRQYAATRRGEMIHAVNLGIPFWPVAFSHAPNLAQYEAALRRRLRTVPEVQAVTALDVTFVGDEVKYTATLRTTAGDLVAING